MIQSRAVLFVVAGLLALAASVSVASDAALPEIPEIPFETFVLDNGLTLIVHEDHKAPIVAVNVWYHVGSKNEKPGKTGFAHLFEHLMFNGSENFNDDYFKVLEKIGATDLNGTTNEDRTNYFQNVPVTALDTVLWMESDRMGHMVGAIDQAKLAIGQQAQEHKDKIDGHIWKEQALDAATQPGGLNCLHILGDRLAIPAEHVFEQAAHGP